MKTKLILIAVFCLSYLFLCHPDMLAQPCPLVSTPTSGVHNVCVGSTLNLIVTGAGNANESWASSNTAVATVAGTGGVGSGTATVTGVTAGVANISYLISGVFQCGYSVTVNQLPPTPAAITGTTTFCYNSTTTLHDATTGGKWFSGNTSIATVNSTSGLVTGVLPGTDVITYTVANPAHCTSSVTTNITLEHLPDPGYVGNNEVCQGSNAPFASTGDAGGTWSSANTAIGTIDPSTGMAYGVSAGTTTISYTVTNSCGPVTTTATLTVQTPITVAAITGPSQVCVGSNVTLADVTTGDSYYWSSANTAVATVDPSSGVVTGISAGTVNISYGAENSCGWYYNTQSETVNPLPTPGTLSSIPAGFAVCATSGTITLSSTTGGGTWSSSSPGNATIGSSSGVVTGVAGGSTTITYTVTSIYGCSAYTTQLVTVNVTPSAGTISGTLTVCAGSTTTLSSSGDAGTWTSGTTAYATVDPGTGVVTGVAAGTSIITYTATNSCSTVTATVNVTVNPLPNAGAITGTLDACSSVSPTLSDAGDPGTWSSDNTAIATIGASTGVVTAVSAGTVTISYTTTNSCGTAYATASYTVNPNPNAGTIYNDYYWEICQGSTTTLYTDGDSYGSWTSSSTAVATVGSTDPVTALVTAVGLGTSTGSANITYTVTNSCGTAFATYAVSVDLPGPISVTGAGSLINQTSVNEYGMCMSGSLTFTPDVPDGVWSTTYSTGSIGSTSGVVTPITADALCIFQYNVSNVCGAFVVYEDVYFDNNTYTVTVTGSTSVSSGADYGYTASPAVYGITSFGETDTWGISNTSPATSYVVGSSSNVTVLDVYMQGATGVTTINYSYTNSCGSFSLTTPVSVSIH